MNKILKYINNPSIIPGRLLKAFGPYMNDKPYLQLLWRLSFKERLNLKNPQTFNEKLQWLKLYDRNPLYTILVDKCLVKDYVSKIIGDSHVIPLIKRYDNPNQISLDDLPDRFVLKCNHNSGSIWICKNKEEFDLAKVKSEIAVSLKDDYYIRGREWPYKNVKRCIIAEPYMEDSSTHQLIDYKVFCFNGSPKIIQIDEDRFSGHRRNIFSDKGVSLGYSVGNDAQIDEGIQCPPNDQLMQLLDFAARLSKGIPHVRVDFYIIDGCVYFGEMTFFHNSGFAQFSPESVNHLWGSWISLPSHGDANYSARL